MLCVDMDRCAFLTALKISKLVLTTVGYAQVQVIAEACQSESSGSAAQIAVTPAMHNHAVILQKALQCVPNPNTDFIMRNTASRLGQFLTKQVSLLLLLAYASKTIVGHLVSQAIVAASAE